MNTLFAPQPKAAHSMTVEELARFEILESGWLSFERELAARSHDRPEDTRRDAFYAGAALLIIMLTTLAEDDTDDFARRVICEKIDREVSAFNAAHGYHIHFTPHVRP